MVLTLGPTLLPCDRWFYHLELKPPLTTSLHMAPIEHTGTCIYQGPRAACEGAADLGGEMHTTFTAAFSLGRWS